MAHRGLWRPSQAALADTTICVSLMTPPDVALNDLRAIKEMRPDLGDLDLAYLVRTADDDEDVDARCRRVMSYNAQRSHVA
jgi:hypothetical protein